MLKLRIIPPVEHRPIAVRVADTPCLATASEYTLPITADSPKAQVRAISTGRLEMELNQSISVAGIPLAPWISTNTRYEAYGGWEWHGKKYSTTEGDN